MNVPDRVYGMYVLTVRKTIVFSYKLYWLLRLSNPYPMIIIYLMHERQLNHWLFSNWWGLIYSDWRDSNRRDLSQR